MNRSKEQIMLEYLSNFLFEHIKADLITIGFTITKEEGVFADKIFHLSYAKMPYLHIKFEMGLILADLQFIDRDIHPRETDHRFFSDCDYANHKTRNCLIPRYQILADFIYGNSDNQYVQRLRNIVLSGQYVQINYELA